MEQRLFEVVARIMRVPIGSIGLDSSPEAIPSWDSLSHMNLVLEVEDVFGIRFSDGDIVEMKDVCSILEKLKGCGAA